MREKILFCWSGGKDSAMALWSLLSEGAVEVVGLLTTLTRDYDRVTMHGVRRALIEEQARSIGLPLTWVEINPSASNEEYERNMGKTLEDFVRRGVARVAFGDIFLEDLRQYRLKQLARLDLGGLFPLWGRDTRELSSWFVDQGFRARTTCVDLKKLGPEFAGRLMDRGFFGSLPAGVDPCGENGEFHSFVSDGPLFKNEVKYRTGEKVTRGDFCFADLIPETHPAPAGSR